MIEGWLVLPKVLCCGFKYGGKLSETDKNKCKYLPQQKSLYSIINSLLIVADWFIGKSFSSFETYYVRFYYDGDTPLPPEYVYDTYDDISEIEKDYDNKRDFMHDFYNRLKNMGVTHILIDEQFKKL